jgi:hypothetical protein
LKGVPNKNRAEKLAHLGGPRKLCLYDFVGKVPKRTWTVDPNEKIRTAAPRPVLESGLIHDIHAALNRFGSSLDRVDPPDIHGYTGYLKPRRVAQMLEIFCLVPVAQFADQLNAEILEKRPPDLAARLGTFHR